MKVFVLLVLLCGVLIVGSLLADEEDKPFDPRKFAYEITKKDLGEEGWKKYLKKTLERIDDFTGKDMSGDAQNFLDDRLTDLASEVGDLDSLKKFCAWVAVYYALELDLPPRAIKGFKKHEKELRELSKDFTWEKLLAMVQKEDKNAKP